MNEIITVINKVVISEWNNIYERNNNNIIYETIIHEKNSNKWNSSKLDNDINETR